MKVAAGRVDEFPSGSIKILSLDERPIGIVNTGETFYAVLNVCPHALAPVCEGVVSGTLLPSPAGAEPVWGLEGRVLRCPWHGWEFDLADGGRSIFTDYRARVRVFPVSVEDGTVYVELKERRAAAADSSAA